MKNIVAVAFLVLFSVAFFDSANSAPCRDLYEDLEIDVFNLELEELVDESQEELGVRHRDKDPETALHDWKPEEEPVDKSGEGILLDRFRSSTDTPIDYWLPSSFALAKETPWGRLTELGARHRDKDPETTLHDWKPEEEPVDKSGEGILLDGLRSSTDTPFDYWLPSSFALAKETPWWMLEEENQRVIALQGPATRHPPATWR